MNRNPTRQQLIFMEETEASLHQEIPIPIRRVRRSNAEPPEEDVKHGGASEASLGSLRKPQWPERLRIDWRTPLRSRLKPTPTLDSLGETRSGINTGPDMEEDKRLKINSAEGPKQPSSRGASAERTSYPCAVVAYGASPTHTPRAEAPIKMSQKVRAAVTERRVRGRRFPSHSASRSRPPEKQTVRGGGEN